MTAADHNIEDDRFQYKRGQPWALHDQIIGKALFRIPNIGLPTLALNNIFKQGRNPLPYYILVGLAIVFGYVVS